MRLKVIQNEMAVCKLEDLSNVDYSDEIFFVSKTDEEISLVCSMECIPQNAKEYDEKWRAFRIEGVLDFSLIGILAKISTILAENKIGIFAISTFNTDYILTKSENFKSAIAVLGQAGYDIIE